MSHDSASKGEVSLIQNQIRKLKFRRNRSLKQKRNEKKRRHSKILKRSGRRNKIHEVLPIVFWVEQKIINTQYMYQNCSDQALVLENKYHNEAIHWFNNQPGNSTLEDRNRLKYRIGFSDPTPHLIRCCYICQREKCDLFECCECKKLVDADHMCYDARLRYDDMYKVCNICVFKVNRQEFERRLAMTTPYRAPAGCVQRLRGTGSFAARSTGKYKSNVT